MKPRVLLVHNAYQQRGGEDAVVDAELALLRTQGHEVALYGRHNDEIRQLSRLRLARDTCWSPRTGHELTAQVAHFKPHVIHAHNTFPLISPALYWAAARLGIPLVQTLHNFRLLCPQGIFLREQRICQDCLGRAPWPALLHRCYHDSLAQTGVLAGMLSLHRGLGTWQHKITRYIVLNEFCRQQFIAAGLPAARISIKPNFVDLPAAPALHQQRRDFLYVGRLSEEKGIAVLAQLARALPDCRLRVAGSGPQQVLLQGLDNVELLGQLSAAGIQAEMHRAAALLLPSICYESFPRTLVEAYACGLPVIAHRLGALAELVSAGETGLLCDVAQPQEFIHALRWAQSHPLELADMGAAARVRYEARYTPQTNYALLMDIYAEARAAVASSP